MTTLRLAPRRIAALAGPTSLLLIPKCPLCLLPLLAGAGISAPASLVLVINVLVAFIAAVWTWFVFSVASSPVLRACSVVLSALLVGGRAFHFVPAITTYLVVLVMLLLAAGVSRRCECVH
jgi:hypothetical protein